MYPYRNPMLPITAERAMQCITSAVSGSQSDKDKLMKIETYIDAWVFEKPEPLP